MILHTHEKWFCLRISSNLFREVAQFLLELQTRHLYQWQTCLFHCLCFVSPSYAIVVTMRSFHCYKSIHADASCSYISPFIDTVLLEVLSFWLVLCRSVPFLCKFCCCNLSVILSVCGVCVSYRQFLRFFYTDKQTNVWSELRHLNNLVELSSSCNTVITCTVIVFCRLYAQISVAVCMLWTSYFVSLLPFRSAAL